MKNWETTFVEELNRTEGDPVQFWLRDDDAVQDGPQLQRLFETARGIPINLAVIPRYAVSFDLPEDVFVLQHGIDHSSHAGAGEKNSEFPASRESARLELRQGIDKLDQLFGNRFRKVFVPPWNRIGSSHFGDLAEVGFTHLSSHFRHPPSPLIDCPVHVNINRSEGRNFLRGMTRAIQRGDRLIGVLTHHGMHDEKCWKTLERFVSAVRNHPRAVWCDLEGFHEGETPIASDLSE